ncbi:MAG: TadE/TadG family type IV pilus assembly protein [Hyphomonas sp.]
MIAHSFGYLTPRLIARWNAYADDRRGSAAVEFAMIAVPFFFLIFGLIEVCILFIMTTVLEHSINEASRDIRTGQVHQSGTFDQAAFRQSICDQLFEMLECNANLHIDVRRINSFSSASMADPLDEDGNFDDSQMSYQPGGREEIISVRVYYEWGLMTPILSKPLQNMAGNKHLIQTSAVFRNEPY